MFLSLGEVGKHSLPHLFPGKICFLNDGHTLLGETDDTMKSQGPRVGRKPRIIAFFGQMQTRRINQVVQDLTGGSFQHSPLPKTGSGFEDCQA